MLNIFILNSFTFITTMIKRTMLAWLTVCSMSLAAFASPPDEGMWLPMFVERLNYTDMQKLGLQLTAEEIYSINHSSLKDAIVMLGGGFCSSELVSPEGLLLTNHHCAYDLIQSHSSVEHDYLTDGFWAMKKTEELANPGLTASILVRMEDVTPRMKAAIEKGKAEERDAIVAAEQNAIIEETQKENANYEIKVKSFFDGNEYYMFIYETFRDVRLVGAPPSSIGKYGGDTDNWMWTRHTGDFSVLRIYAGKDNKPADYSADNVPYKPKHFLPVSLDGVQEKDYAMIMGFPGTTDRYLTSNGVNLAIEKTNPTRVKIRGKLLETMKEHMDSDKAIEIKYASKYASISNYWKYFIGQTRGLKRLDVADKKKQEEDAFRKWVNADRDRKKKYGEALELVQQAYEELDRSALHNVYLNEAVFGSEIMGFAYNFSALEPLLMMKSTPKADLDAAIEQIRQTAAAYYKDYDRATDQDITGELMTLYAQGVSQDDMPAVLKAANGKFKGDYRAYVKDMFNRSFMSDPTKLEAFLKKPTLKALKADPAYAAFNDIFTNYRQKVAPSRKAAFEKLSQGNRLYVAGVREMNPDKKYYPNANSTMRLTYGQVLSYKPQDATFYNYFTTADGILEKEDPTNPEFIVPAKLNELIRKKDFGQYADKDGSLHVNFLSNTDITGGNSGSAVMNNKGELIGIAFDGNWEAMSGDIAFEPNFQRTISVDIRYVLFVIDKYAGATNLIKEMKLMRGSEDKKEDKK